MRIVIDNEDLKTLNDGFVVYKSVNDWYIELVLHKNTQAHRHVAGNESNIDKCKVCGLDIRDNIHKWNY